MNRRIFRYIGNIMISAAFMLIMTANAAAQDYVAPPVRISEQKVKIDGKVFYSHVVEERQTLYSICKAYNVTQEDLFKANPALQESGLKKNSIILIPTENAPVQAKKEPKKEEPKKEEPKKEEVYKQAEDATASVKTIHTVRWYEDLTVIAGKYGVSEESIMAANKLADKKLKNRQKLIIPNTEAVVAHVVQTEADVQEEEEITDLETAFDQPSEEYTPVFAAPKNKDVKAVVLLPLKATGTTGSRSNMDFYSGMLLAARELGEEGVNLEMDVYDIASGALGATRSELEDCDLVIGPVSADDISRIYSSAPGIKALISPLDPRAESILSSHPTMIHAPSSRNMQYKDLAQWIREDMQEGDKVVIISEKEGKTSEEGKLMRVAVDSAHIAYTPFSYSILEGREVQEPLEALLTAEGVNRIVIASESEAFVNDVVRNLNLVIHNKFNIALYGPAKIRTFETIEVENFHNAGLHASLTYYIDYESDDVKNFLMKYRALFNTEPTQFAFQGYDVAKYFIGLCAKYGDDWKNHLDKECKMLQSTFMMNNSENGGYSNKGIRRILYGDRYSVETIK